jgi:phage tail sheath protein FI
MPIYQQGSLNTTSLVVPDLYVQIVSPQNLVLNGVPTNVIGVVGSASWGPTNQPVAVATMADYAVAFGPVSARKYDMGTSVASSIQQGASNFRCVRVSDGTDVAASYAVGVAGGSFSVLLTARYTGSLGNLVTLTLSPASVQGQWQLTVSMPGQVPEVYNNIANPNPALFWQNLVAAINFGKGPLRGPSNIVQASLGTATAAAPSGFSPQSLTGGSDGAVGVSSANLIGQDTVPRSGMFALRSQACGIGVLADLDDATTWTSQAAFGLSEGLYMILTGPVGQSISTAISLKQQAGLDSYATKLMFGDWVYWNDQTNGVMRLVSPQGFVAGRLANLSPEQSSLNKPLYSVVGTQRSGLPGSGQTSTYSDAELALLFQNSIDVITSPQPGGMYWGVRCGHNTSSNVAISGDNYTRLTNYVAATLAAGMGAFVGEVINTNLFRRIRSTQLSFLQNLFVQGVLGSVTGVPPFSVICDNTNNPNSRTSLGFVQSDAQVQFQSINEKFIVNVEGGQTVAIQRQVLPSGLI